MGFGVSKDTYQYLPEGYKHTFLIRNPLRSIYSYRKSRMGFQRSSEGLCSLEDENRNEREYDLARDDQWFHNKCYVKDQYDLWMHVKENLDSNPVVIDADDLLTKPKETLSAYCAAVGLPYSDSLLQCDASVDAMRKIKAPGDELLVKEVNFYGMAMRSSSFHPPSPLPSRDTLTPDVIKWSDRAMNYYKEMYERRLKV